MKRRFWQACAAFLLCFLIGSVTEVAQTDDKLPKPVEEPKSDSSIVKGELLVTLHPGYKEEVLKPIFERFEAKYEVKARSSFLSQYTLQTDPERLAEIRQRLANHPYVLSASFNTIYDLQQDNVTKPNVNDPVFDKPQGKLVDGENWNLYRVKAPDAWKITKGGALIAVLDSGTKADHEELRGRMLQGISFAPNQEARDGVKKMRRDDKSIYEQEVRDHGTHVAITAAGSLNNGVGTAGIAPDSQILPIQGLYYFPSEAKDGTGKVSGNTDQLVAGLEQAILQGAAVVNCSFGTNLDKKQIDRWRAAATDEEKRQIELELMPAVRRELDAYSRVLDLANQRGTIIVASAGNQNMPAHLYALPLSQRVISVAAVNSKDGRWESSNYGVFTTVSAPGAEIYSGLARDTKEKGYYGTMSGTSMAAPHVTGIVALMKTLDPDLKHADVVDILVSTGERLTTDQPIGPLVNASAAVEETRRRRDAKAARQPTPPPLAPTVPPELPPDVIIPELPTQPITLIERPDPWNSITIQQIIQVWLSMAIANRPEGGAVGGYWVYNQFGQVINVRVSITIQQPIWVGFQFRWLWENSMLMQSTNMGSLYEFIVGTLRQGRFNPAPSRVPVDFRPRETDPRPRQGQGGIPFDPTLRETRWAGVNIKRESIDFTFTKTIVTIVRGGKTLRYRVRINTYFNPMVIDLYPEGEGEMITGLMVMTSFGEILFRTDFNKTRPTSISRNDPLTFVLKRTDIEIKEPNGNADGMQLPVQYRGTETIIRSLNYPQKLDPKTAWTAFGNERVFSYALSDDGKRVWIVLFNPNEKELSKRVQIWSMSTNGGDAKQSTFDWPEHAGNFDRIQTNFDGSTAWFLIRYKKPFTDDSHAFVQKAKVGEKASLVLNTLGMKGITTTTEWRLSANGRSVLLITNEGLMQIDEAGKHHLVFTKNDLEYKKHSAKEGMALSNLVQNADGTRWAFVARIKPFLGQKAPSVVVIGGGKGHPQTVVEEKPDGTFLEYQRLIMTADGQTVLIQRNGQGLLWRDGKMQAIRSEHLGVYNGLLSGDGKTLHAACRTFGHGAELPDCSWIEDLTTGQRRRAMTGGIPSRWDTWWTQNDIRLIQMSHDGKTIASLPQYEVGVSLFQSGAAPSKNHPVIKAVRQRYEDGKLVVSVEANAPDKLGRIMLIPLKNGYLPPFPLTEQKKNPLLHSPSEFRAVPKRDGIFEGAINIGESYRYLDNTYSFRIVVVNADQTHATFEDFPVLK